MTSKTNRSASDVTAAIAAVLILGAVVVLLGGLFWALASFLANLIGVIVWIAAGIFVLGVLTLGISYLLYRIRGK